MEIDEKAKVRLLHIVPSALGIHHHLSVGLKNLLRQIIPVD